jgi:hypothetical protein
MTTSEYEIWGRGSNENGLKLGGLVAQPYKHQKPLNSIFLKGEFYNELYLNKIRKTSLTFKKHLNSEDGNHVKLHRHRKESTGGQVFYLCYSIHFYRKPVKLLPS